MVYLPTFTWANYNDVSRGHLKLWFSKGIPPKSPKDSGLGIILICPDLPNKNQPFTRRPKYTGIVPWIHPMGLISGASCFFYNHIWGGSFKVSILPRGSPSQPLSWLVNLPPPGHVPPPQNK